jgi:hypothetical protein
MIALGVVLIVLGLLFPTVHHRHCSPGDRRGAVGLGVDRPRGRRQAALLLKPSTDKKDACLLSGHASLLHRTHIGMS